MGSDINQIKYFIFPIENATFIRDDTVQGGAYLGNAPVIDGRGITIAREAHEIVKEYEAEKTTLAGGKSVHIIYYNTFLIWGATTRSYYFIANNQAQGISAFPLSRPILSQLD